MYSQEMKKEVHNIHLSRTLMSHDLAFKNTQQHTVLKWAITSNVNKHCTAWAKWKMEEFLIILRDLQKAIQWTNGHIIDFPQAPHMINERTRHGFLVLVTPTHQIITTAVYFTFLLSLSHVEYPFVSIYCNPKNQISLRPIVFTTWNNISINQRQPSMRKILFQTDFLIKCMLDCWSQYIPKGCFQCFQHLPGSDQMSLTISMKIWTVPVYSRQKNPNFIDYFT